MEGFRKKVNEKRDHGGKKKNTRVKAERCLYNVRAQKTPLFPHAMRPQVQRG